MYENSAMNILVTGGCGYIGSHTCLVLIKMGYHPIILDNLVNSKYSVLDRIERLTQYRPIFFQGDVRDAKLLDHIFATHSISSVMHFAGLKSVGESVTQPLDYYDVNVYGSLVLFQRAVAAGIKKIIFSSSATVYGEQDSSPYIESMSVGVPSNPYGQSKLMTEQILIDLSRVNHDLTVCILRYFNPVGAEPNGTMGEDPLGVPNNLVPYISQVAIGLREYVSVYGNDYPTPDGTGIRDYIHVMDLAEAHVKALIVKGKSSGLHIYNLGTGEGVSVLEMISTFATISKKEIPYKFVGRREGDLAAVWADSQKAQNELGWRPKNNLNKMIEDTWRWQSQNPKGYE